MDSSVSETAVSLPAPSLRPFIRRYAGFRITGMSRGEHFGLPSSDVDLIISLGPRIEVLQMPNSAQAPASFSALVAGLQQAPALLRNGTEVFGLHVFMTPLGAAAILGVPSCALSMQVTALSNLWPSCATPLVERLRSADSWLDRFAILDETFIARLDPRPIRPDIEWAWRRLRSAHGAVSIGRLAGEVGFSRRHFSERFRHEIGVTPKAAARVFRFERACRIIQDKRWSLALVAAACGYSDQAHMSREWQALAGSSPRQWIARELPFLQDYELGGDDDGEP